MRNLLIIAGVLLSYMVGAQDFEFNKQVVNEKVTIRYLDDQKTIILVPDANPDYRFLPQFVPPEFRITGLHITITGMAAQIPPNVQLTGTPIKLQILVVEKEDAAKHHLTTKPYRFKGSEGKVPKHDHPSMFEG